MRVCECVCFGEGGGGRVGQRLCMLIERLSFVCERM